MTTESPEVRAAAERRAGWRESCNYPDYPARSPYGDDGGSGRERIQDAMNLADAYLAIRAELARLRDERGDDGEAVRLAARLTLAERVCEAARRTIFDLVAENDCEFGPSKEYEDALAAWEAGK